jgi:hypothetical protein
MSKNPNLVGVVGAVHPFDEEFPIELVRSLQTHPIAGVEAILADEEGVRLSEAGIFIPRSGRNMSKYLSTGRPVGDSYLSRRGPEVCRWSQRFRSVLDFHTSTSEDDTAVWLVDDPATGFRTTSEATAIAGLLQFDRAIVTSYRADMAGCNSRAATLEIGNDNKLFLDVDHWRRELAWLAGVLAANELDTAVLGRMTRYRHLGTVSPEERDAAGLPDSLPNFSQIGAVPLTTTIAPVLCMSWEPGRKLSAGEAVIPYTTDVITWDCIRFGQTSQQPAGAAALVSVG